MDSSNLLINTNKNKSIKISVEGVKQENTVFDPLSYESRMKRRALFETDDERRNRELLTAIDEIVGAVHVESDAEKRNETINAGLASNMCGKVKERTKKKLLKQDIKKYGEASVSARQMHSEFYMNMKQLFEKEDETEELTDSNYSMFSDSIAKINDLWDTKIEGDTFLDFFEIKTTELLNLYDDSIEKAVGYLGLMGQIEGNNFIEQKKAIVENMHKILVKERAMINLSFKQYVDRNYNATDDVIVNKEGVKTLADILYDVRTEKITGNVEKGEGGATESIKKVVIKENGEDVNYFFKENENLPLNSPGIDSCLKDFEKEYKRKNGNTRDDSALKDLYTRFGQVIRHIGKNISKINQVRAEANKKPVKLDKFVHKFQKMANELIYKDVLKNAENLKKLIKDNLPDDLGGNDMAAMEYNVDLSDLNMLIASLSAAENTVLKQQLDEFQAKYKHSIIMQGISSYNELKGGSNLTVRSIATSRVANVLGMEDVIVKTKNCAIMDGKVMKQGILMEAAEGITMAQLLTNVKISQKKIAWTEDASNKFMQLQLLDLICGQGDRHTGNFIVKTKTIGDTIYITNVKGIDNDMSFGKMSKDQISKSHNRTSALFNQKKSPEEALKDINLTHIDEATYNKITAMSWDVLKNSIIDLGISREETDMLRERLELVQKALRDEATKNPEFVIKSGNKPLKSMRSYWKYISNRNPLHYMINHRVVDMNSYNEMTRNLNGDEGNINENLNAVFEAINPIVPMLRFNARQNNAPRARGKVMLGGKYNGYFIPDDPELNELNDKKDEVYKIAKNNVVDNNVANNNEPVIIDNLVINENKNNIKNSLGQSND